MAPSICSTFADMMRWKTHDCKEKKTKAAKNTNRKQTDNNSKQHEENRDKDLKTILKKVRKSNQVLHLVLASSDAYDKGLNSCETCRMNKDDYKKIMQDIKVVGFVVDGVIEKEQAAQMEFDSGNQSDVNAGTVEINDSSSSKSKVSFGVGNSPDEVNHSLQCVLIKLQRAIGDVMTQVCFVKTNHLGNSDRFKKFDIELDDLRMFKLEYNYLTDKIIVLFKQPVQNKTSDICVTCLKEKLCTYTNIMTNIVKSGKKLKLVMKNQIGDNAEGQCCYRTYPHIHAEAQGRPIVLKYSMPLTAGKTGGGLPTPTTPGRRDSHGNDVKSNTNLQSDPSTHGPNAENMFSKDNIPNIQSKSKLHSPNKEESNTNDIQTESKLHSPSKEERHNDIQSESKLQSASKEERDNNIQSESKLQSTSKEERHNDIQSESKLHSPSKEESQTNDIQTESKLHSPSKEERHNDIQSESKLHSPNKEESHLIGSDEDEPPGVTFKDRENKVMELRYSIKNDSLTSRRTVYGSVDSNPSLDKRSVNSNPSKHQSGDKDKDNVLATHKDNVKSNPSINSDYSSDSDIGNLRTDSQRLYPYKVNQPELRPVTSNIVPLDSTKSTNHSKMTTMNKRTSLTSKDEPNGEESSQSENKNVMLENLDKKPDDGTVSLSPSVKRIKSVSFDDDGIVSAVSSEEHVQSSSKLNKNDNLQSKSPFGNKIVERTLYLNPGESVLPKNKSISFIDDSSEDTIDHPDISSVPGTSNAVINNSPQESSDLKQNKAIVKENLNQIKEVKHHNKKVETILSSLGKENLRMISSPAKCSRGNTLLSSNTGESYLPLSVSLYSLPLDINDLKYIANEIGRRVPTEVEEEDIPIQEYRWENRSATVTRKDLSDTKWNRAFAGNETPCGHIHCKGQSSVLLKHDGEQAFDNWLPIIEEETFSEEEINIQNEKQYNGLNEPEAIQNNKKVLRSKKPTELRYCMVEFENKKIGDMLVELLKKIESREHLKQQITIKKNSIRSWESNLSTTTNNIPANRKKSLNEIENCEVQKQRPESFSNNFKSSPLSLALDEAIMLNAIYLNGTNLDNIELKLNSPYNNNRGHVKQKNVRTKFSTLYTLHHKNKNPFLNVTCSNMKKN